MQTTDSWVKPVCQHLAGELQERARIILTHGCCNLETLTDASQYIVTAYKLTQIVDGKRIVVKPVLNRASELLVNHHHDDDHIPF